MPIHLYCVYVRSTTTTTWIVQKERHKELEGLSQPFASVSVVAAAAAALVGRARLGCLSNFASIGRERTKAVSRASETLSNIASLLT